jgi:hypothetical protein
MRLCYGYPGAAVVERVRLALKYVSPENLLLAPAAA